MLHPVFVNSILRTPKFSHLKYPFTYVRVHTQDVDMEHSYFVDISRARRFKNM